MKFWISCVRPNSDWSLRHLPSNVHRVSQILEAAIKCGRKVIVFGRSMENVVDIGRKMGTIKVKNSDFLSPDELAHIPDEKVCIICTGSQGEPWPALSRISNGTHRYIHIKPGDTIVFSSNPIPGNASSVNKVIDNLFRSGATVIDKVDPKQFAYNRTCF